MKGRVNALRENTKALNGVRVAIENLAGHTGEWRKDDAKHHRQENELDSAKVELLLKIAEKVLGHKIKLKKKK